MVSAVQSADMLDKAESQETLGLFFVKWWWRDDKTGGWHNKRREVCFIVRNKIPIITNESTGLKLTQLGKYTRSERKSTRAIFVCG